MKFLGTNLNPVKKKKKKKPTPPLPPHDGGQRGGWELLFPRLGQSSFLNSAADPGGWKQSVNAGTGHRESPAWDWGSRGCRKGQAHSEAAGVVKVPGSFLKSTVLLGRKHGAELALNLKSLSMCCWNSALETWRSWKPTKNQIIFYFQCDFSKNYYHLVW